MKQELEHNLTLLQQNAVQSLNARQGVYSRTAGLGLLGEQPTSAVAGTLNKLQASLSSVGVTMDQLVKGTLFKGKSFEQITAIQKIMTDITKLDPVKATQRVTEIYQTESANMVKELTDNTPTAKENAKAQVKEYLDTNRAKFGKNGPSFQIAGKGMMTLRQIADDGEASQKFIVDHSDEVLDVNKVMVHLLKRSADLQEVTPQEIADQLAKAREMGRQTRSISDAIGAAMAKWMTELIQLVEWIADKLAAWLGGSTVEEDRKKFEDAWKADVPQMAKSLDSLQTQMDENRLKQEKQDPGTAAGKALLAKLQADYAEMQRKSELIQGFTGIGYASESDKKNVEDAMHDALVRAKETDKAQNPVASDQPKMNDAMGKMADKLGAGGVDNSKTSNTYIDVNVGQKTTAPGVHGAADKADSSEHAGASLRPIVPVAGVMG